MTNLVSHEVKLHSPWNCLRRCQAFDPGFLGEVDCLLLVAHHHECAGVDFIPMPRDQLLKSVHITLLGRLDQSLITG